MKDVVGAAICWLGFLVGLVVFFAMSLAQRERPDSQESLKRIATVDATPDLLLHPFSRSLVIVADSTMDGLRWLEAHGLLDETEPCVLPRAGIANVIRAATLDGIVVAYEAESLERMYSLPAREGR